MINSPLFLLDPNFGYPFARIDTTGDETEFRTAAGIACVVHFEKPVRHVSTLYLEHHGTLKVLFKDGSDVFIDVDFDEPEIQDETPF